MRLMKPRRSRTPYQGEKQWTTFHQKIFQQEQVPQQAGNEIKVNCATAPAEEGYIVKQKGSKKFVCEEIETAGEFTCTLATGKLPAALTSGEMAISFKMDDGETYGVSKITGRKATLVASSSTGPKRI